MPTPKQMETMSAAAAIGRNASAAGSPGPADGMPPEYWDAVLRDVSADAGPSTRTQRLAQITRHLACSRCARIVEIQKADAVRLYGPQAVWKDCAERLLDDTCQERTGRLEEDGCWPSIE